MPWKKHLGSLGQHETLGGALKLGGTEGHLEAEDEEFPGLGVDWNNLLFGHECLMFSKLVCSWGPGAPGLSKQFFLHEDKRERAGRARLRTLNSGAAL